jgi:cardiolipin-specific phospholipase
MFPFSFRTSTAEFESRFEIAEEKLLEIAKRRSTRPTHSWDVTTLDTHIPRAAVPCLRPATTDEEKTLKIHSVKVVSKEPIRDVPKNDTAQIPLVLLHGYMNCGQYFYRNFAGLSRHFRTIYSVDLLGWGLSSRPPFEQVMESDTIKSAEDFFVESLEAWRKMVRVKTIASSRAIFGLDPTSSTIISTHRMDRLTSYSTEE